MSSKQIQSLVPSSLASSWPAGIEFDPGSATYRYSLQDSYNIDPLSHVHLILMDEVAPPSPLEMTLTLPNQQFLPYQSRLYFFYVEQANEDDLLTFVPVLGSGNTINGNALGFTFTLNGNRELFIAIGVQNNYIIHKFGLNATAPPVHVPTPKVFFPLTTTAGVNTTAVTYPLAGAGVATASVTVGATAFGAEAVINSGMEGFITQNVAIPTTTLAGFRCNVSGWYNVTPQLRSLTIFSSASNPTPNWLCFTFARFSSAGAYQAATSVFSPSLGSFNATLSNPTQMRQIANGTFYVQMTEGEIYLPCFTYDSTNFVFTSTTWGGNIFFEYVIPDTGLPVAPLSVFSEFGGDVGGGEVMAMAMRDGGGGGSSLADGVAQQNEDPSLRFSMSDKLGPIQKTIKEIQKKYREELAQKQYGASSSSFSYQPQQQSMPPPITLSDMEAMVRRVVNSNAAAASSSSSVDQQTPPPPAFKKRKTRPSSIVLSSKEMEKEPA